MENCIRFKDDDTNEVATNHWQAAFFGSGSTVGQNVVKWKTRGAHTGREYDMFGSSVQFKQTLVRWSVMLDFFSLV